ncbi:hypothetical protein J6590_044390 [Homalodisca vitripennis]|nr:hypothetical protein J6590_044390 [Homalodisca vitripennis]
MLRYTDHQTVGREGGQRSVGRESTAKDRHGATGHFSAGLRRGRGSMNGESPAGHSRTDLGPRHAVALLQESGGYPVGSNERNFDTTAMVDLWQPDLKFDA